MYQNSVSWGWHWHRTGTAVPVRQVRQQIQEKRGKRHTTSPRKRNQGEREWTILGGLEKNTLSTLPECNLEKKILRQ